MTVKYNRGETYYTFEFKDRQLVLFEKKQEGSCYTSHIIADLNPIWYHAVIEELKLLTATPYTIGIFRLLAMNLDKSSKCYPTFERIATENGIEL